jgi:hypothetical protein
MKTYTARVKTKRPVQMADRLWRIKMTKEIGFKLFVK